MPVLLPVFKNLSEKPWNLCKVAKGVLNAALALSLPKTSMPASNVT
jgi:hypothetical protein